MRLLATLMARVTARIISVIMWEVNIIEMDEALPRGVVDRRAVSVCAGAVRGRRRGGGARAHGGGGVARRDRRAGGRALRGQLRLRAPAVRAVRARRAHTRVQQDQVQDT